LIEFRIFGFNNGFMLFGNDLGSETNGNYLISHMDASKYVLRQAQDDRQLKKFFLTQGNKYEKFFIHALRLRSGEGECSTGLPRTVSLIYLLTAVRTESFDKLKTGFVEVRTQ